MSTIKLKSAQVLITGAGSGIGYALALAFAREGANIIATDIAPAGLEKLKPEVEALGVQYHTELLDVTCAAAFESLARALADRNQIPDILVNNAGIGVAKSILNTGLEDWEALIKVNLYGMLNGSTAFVRLWLDKGVEAHLVNVASSVATAPLPGMTAYAASKAAAYSLSEGLAGELAGSNIKVTTICPGAINTNITNREGSSDLPPEQLEEILKYYREQGTAPSQVADAVVSAVKKYRPVVYVGNGARGVDMGRRFLPVMLFRKLLVKTSRQLGLINLPATAK